MIKLSDKCVICTNERCIRVEDKKIHLSLMEMNLLRFLISHQGEVLGKEVIIKNVWPEECEHHVCVDNLSQLIHRVRKTLAICGFDNTLTTIRNRGYKLILDQQDVRGNDNPDFSAPYFPESREDIISPNITINVEICYCKEGDYFIIYTYCIVLVLLISRWFGFF